MNKRRSSKRAKKKMPKTIHVECVGGGRGGINTETRVLLCKSEHRGRAEKKRKKVSEVRRKKRSPSMMRLKEGGSYCRGLGRVGASSRKKKPDLKREEQGGPWRKNPDIVKKERDSCGRRDSVLIAERTHGQPLQTVPEKPNSMRRRRMGKEE